jgi:hypothetical protein
MESEPFVVQVEFSGLMLFVKRNGEVVQVLLREARRPHGPDHLEHHHEPVVLWGHRLKKLDRIRLSLEWLDDGGDVIPVSSGALPAGPPEVGKFPVFDGDRKDDASWTWVPDFGAMGPKNKVAADCTAAAGVSSKVVAQFQLNGGTVRAGQFAWGAEEIQDPPVDEARDRGGRGPRGDNAPQIEEEGGDEADTLGNGSLHVRGTVTWLPALLYKVRDGDAGSKDRAAAEAVIWSVPAPSGARRVRVACRDLDARGTVGPCDDLPLEVDLTPGGRLELKVFNSPAKVDPPMGAVHPGRRANASAKHFHMLYELLEGSPPPALLRIPKLPGAFHPAGALKNVEPYPEATAADDLGSLENRPLCVPGSAEG